MGSFVRFQSLGSHIKNKYLLRIHGNYTFIVKNICIQIYSSCNSFVMTYVGVKCLTRHCSVLRDTQNRGTT